MHIHTYSYTQIRTHIHFHAFLPVDQLPSVVQSAYRAGSSLETALLKAVGDIVNEIKKANQGGLLKPVNGGYFKCWRGGSGSAYFVFYWSTTKSVFNGSMLGEIVIVIGVSQWSVLGPMLFLMHPLDLLGAVYLGSHQQIFPLPSSFPLLKDFNKDFTPNLLKRKRSRRNSKNPTGVSKHVSVAVYKVAALVSDV
ncbi:hypothetical protein HELRODRAFT_180981 [Helobdella robusta]|uniref:Uncharacterized protein n=1 Tax=Helobdella robusta TaxID=6412 RepID=T1FGH6_HELRO|nr:hypothetical protein HELRODRAFT_180981 [Helobdella robusta]ESN93442.1 hypothetical protein HELRODRAFT_180981 [Helobdella robusta]